MCVNESNTLYITLKNEEISQCPLKTVLRDSSEIINIWITESYHFCMANTGNRKQASLPKGILQREPTEFSSVENFSILKNSIVSKCQLSS